LKNILELDSVDVVLTTYQTLVSEFRKRRESSVPYDVKWRRIVLDEGRADWSHDTRNFTNHLLAHDIRDYTRVTAKAIRSLVAGSRWCLTGTPIQNGIDDIAGLYHFLGMEPYADPKMFKEHIRILCSGRNGDAMAGIQRMIRCIMLRRSIASVPLPERKDLICRLDFNLEEREVYQKAKSSTLHLLNEVIDGEGSRSGQLNVLPWINTLRMICNLGTRAKIPHLRPENNKWDSRTAQEMFNGLEIAAVATCNICRLDLGASTSEAADQVSGGLSLPLISSCSYLICAACLESRGQDACSCDHIPAHPMLPVSTFASELSAVEDHATNSGQIPTKIGALMQDLEQHVDHAKW
jgi:SWI/SNF-related matrix-associated actin-dependent regulator of chromatin subfamily A3